jgi:predicted metalloprotease with PDZ domain
VFLSTCRYSPDPTTKKKTSFALAWSSIRQRRQKSNQQKQSLEIPTLIENQAMYRFLLLFIFVLVQLCPAAQVHYQLTYNDSATAVVKISIEPPNPVTAPQFIMPRSIPGGYSIYIYDKCIDDLSAISTNGEKLSMIKDGGGAPRWYFTDTTKKISRIEYEVNLDKMERMILPGDASIIRPGFAGLLDYSLFGWIDGTEKQPVHCSIKTFDSWPIFTTIQPSATPTEGNFTFNTDNYYTLADGQIFMGPQFRVKKYKALVPLFVVSYCQAADEYLDDYAEQEIISMGILKDYFGEIPFPYYSLMLRAAIPLEPVNAPALAMEHLQSSTFFGDTSGIRTKPMSKEQITRTMPTYLHHMGHAFLPLRCYGDAYKPHVEEIPPIINNIWFNEGFMWFLPYDTLKLDRMKIRFHENVYKTSPAIKKLTLPQLSQIASTMYGVDFRLGMAVYSRGAMMAIEMNEFIKEKTGGKRSMKDVFRYFYNWSKENKRPFTMQEFPLLINKAAGVDVSSIYKKWQEAIE